MFALLALELLGGMRVGEATSAVDLHGLAANDLCFASPAMGGVDDGLGETVEAASETQRLVRAAMSHSWLSHVSQD